jgi:hypothetical protein
MRDVAKFVLAIGFAIALTAPARAELLTSVLNPTPGAETNLNDASVSRIFAADGTPLGPNDTIQQGDVVAGVLRINNAISPPSTTFDSHQQLAAVFSFTIGTTSTVVGPALTTLNFPFGTTATSNPNSLANLLAGLPGFSGNPSVALVENPNSTKPTTPLISGPFDTVLNTIRTT